MYCCSAVRRIIMYEAAIRVRGVEPRYDTRIWLMPSNRMSTFDQRSSTERVTVRGSSLSNSDKWMALMIHTVWAGFYYVLQHRQGDPIHIATTVTTDLGYLRIMECMGSVQIVRYETTLGDTNALDVWCLAVQHCSTRDICMFA
jgi:hypothetical protein